MPELLLELFSEEIPARMQSRAAEDLKRLVTDGLKAHGLATGEAYAFATPRRLALAVEGVPGMSPATTEERKGPRVGAPEQAVQGFLKGAGLRTIGQADIVKDPKRGDYYFARIERPGRRAADIIADVVPEVCRRFPWPKSMRWGWGSFTWVRPLHSVLCLLDGRVVPLEVDGVRSGNTTRGHRFHGDEPFEVKGFEDYGRKLKAIKVLLPASERAGMIAEQAQALASKHKLALVEDEWLLAENAGLTEWPTVLMGTFDESFLEVPAECLIVAMRNHQKCFSLRHPRSGKLANKFLMVSNLVPKDGGAQIIAGNEKVIRARLADAKFFWEQDLKRPLDEMAIALEGITFHEKLGTQKDRVERIAELAYQIAGAVDAVPEDARRAAQLAKADLVSGMVGEFPELQGLMGRYYAEAAKTKPEIARAIELHYKPRGPSDTVPKGEEGDAVAVALADKLDTLVGFWAIGEKPTGSGDPYQLRRAALGVIRILLENDLRIAFIPLLRRHMVAILRSFNEIVRNELRLADFSINGDGSLGVRPGVNLNAALSTLAQEVLIENIFDHWDLGDPESQRILLQRQCALGCWIASEINSDRAGTPETEQLLRIGREFFENEVRERTDDLLAFFAERLKVHLREKGARHDLIDAVFALGGQDDLALMVRRVEALGEFLKTEDGANLLVGVKRAQNIVAIEEKKDKRSYDGAADPKLLQLPEEKALHEAIQGVKEDTAAALNVENFAGAMRALAELRPPVDAFFDKVTVNVDEPRLRENRLRLLSEIRAATLNVADFTKIAG